MLKRYAKIETLANTTCNLLSVKDIENISREYINVYGVKEVQNREEHPHVLSKINIGLTHFYLGITLFKGKYYYWLL